MNSRDEFLARYAAPAGTALLALVGAVLAGLDAVTIGGAVGVGIVMVALAWHPSTGWSMVAMAVLALALFVAALDGQAGNIGWFGVCVLAAWVGATNEPRLMLAFVVLATAVFAGEWVARDDGWNAWIAGTAVSGIAGAVGRRQGFLMAQLREAQAGLADRVKAEERSRIAHEIHDVIGHALTVSLIHVTSARVALADDPAGADAALAEAERLGQQSLAEVRAVVSLMRESGSTTPLPGADNLDALVNSFTKAGANVRWEVTGDLSRLTATEGLTVYRILQESLTNAVRHAYGSSVVVRLEVTDAQACLLVESDGAPTAMATVGGGLAGMRARTETLGGALTAGPSGAGWKVQAVLPI